MEERTTEERVAALEDELAEREKRLEAVETGCGNVLTRQRRSGKLLRFGFLIFLVVFSLIGIKAVNVASDASKAADDANAAIKAAEAERAARTETVTQVISLGCNTDNSQDLLLARLVAASLDESAASFGSGVDPSSLTAFDMQVLTTIAKVAAETPTALTSRFRHVLAKLRNTQNCQAIVDAYLAGKPIFGEQESPADQVGHAIGRGVNQAGDK